MSRIRRNGAVGMRGTEVAGLSGPYLLRLGVSKAELREQAAEAVASYKGPITRCLPKLRRAP